MTWAGSGGIVRASSPEGLMRVIAGKYKGRALLCPSGLRVRPTADPVRETIFNLLGGAVDGSRALDVFAGVGTLGIEALSRNAREVHFVEKDRTALRYLRKNLDGVAAKEEAVVFAGDAFRIMRRLHEEGRTYELLFCDPPYGEGLTQRVLSEESESPLVEPGGMLIVQRHAKDPVDLPHRRHTLRRRRVFGDTVVDILEVV